MAHSRGRSFSAPRRTPEWSGVLVFTNISGGTATQSLGSQAQGSAAAVRQTIVRIRGSAVVHMVAGAAADAMVVGLGLIIVSEDALAAGAASIPSPIDDLDSPWIFHQLFSLGPSTASEAADDTNLGLSTARIVIDNKAQRKIGPNEVLTFMWDTQLHAGTPTFDGSAAVRCLSLLV